jgi:hypothetical protein
MKLSFTFPKKSGRGFHSVYKILSKKGRIMSEKNVKRRLRADNSRTAINLSNK